MKRLLFWIAAFIWLPATTYSQVVYETFETGPALPWNALDGAFDVVANPFPTGLNTSDSVGSYTKAGTTGYSLLLAEVTTPLDLSVNNQFKVMIYAAVPTQVLFKLEGPGVPAIEGIKNIATAGVWREYTFDFSAQAGNTGLTKVIFFFDPGVTTSTDSYLFDNISAGPAGPCAGTVPVATMIDNFECQRNASYGVGWDILETVTNPDPSGINTSSGVGKYTNPAGSFNALVIDYNSAIDLSVNNYVTAKVWCPIAGPVLFKLEGGVSPAKEIFVQVTQTSQWIEIGADFSDQAAANHKRIVLFFNAGVNSPGGDVYYLDDIQRIPKPQPGPLEDFEPTKLAWFPLNGDNALNGTFNGAIANPDKSGVNLTDSVGSYTKGSSALSTLVGILPAALDLSSLTQVNLDVWAPAGALKVTMQLSSPTQGVKQVERTLTTTQAWETLAFDFQAFNAITDFDQVQLIFDPGVAGVATFYFDNLRQGSSTVDPCEGTVANPRILDDFECQRNGTYGAGINDLSVINNPDISPANSSLKVGQYNDPTDEWSALVYDFGGPIDLSIFNQVKVKIWSAGLVPLLFKLEGGTSPAVEVSQTVATVNSWQSYNVDFSAHAAENHTRLVIFFNAGVAHSTNDVYYLDDVTLARAAYVGCVSTYENSTFSLKGWRYFANGSLENEPFTVVANPDQVGNASDSVGVFLEAADGETFAGMYADPDAPISLLPGKKTVRMKVWAPRATQMVMKMEGGQNGAPNSGDVSVNYTTANAWQELTWDYSFLPDNSLYNRITLILGFGEIPTANTTIYFDDIVVADGVCGTTGIDREEIKQLLVYPNPTNSQLILEGASDLIRADVFNTMGMKVMSVNINHAEVYTLNVSNLPAGMYILTGYNKNGLAANARFVKQ